MPVDRLGLKERARECAEEPPVEAWRGERCTCTWLALLPRREQDTAEPVFLTRHGFAF